MTTCVSSNMAAAENIIVNKVQRTLTFSVTSYHFPLFTHFSLIKACACAVRLLAHAKLYLKFHSKNRSRSPLLGVG